MTRGGAAAAPGEHQKYGKKKKHTEVKKAFPILLPGCYALRQTMEEIKKEIAFLKPQNPLLAARFVSRVFRGWVERKSL